jgi:hypothetical protein
MSEECARRRWRQVERELLLAFSRRVRQLRRARALLKAQNAALSVGMCFFWKREVQCCKLLRRSSGLTCSLMLQFWCRTASYTLRAQRVAAASGIRSARLLLRMWCRYRQRLSAARELAVSILHVRRARVFKHWYAFQKAWRPIRGGTTMMRRKRYWTTMSTIVSRWASDMAWQKAVAVHAEFLSIERQSKADAPRFRSWRAYTRERRARQQAAAAHSARAMSRCVLDFFMRWRWWSSACASARCFCKTRLLRSAFLHIYCVWFEQRRRLEFFVLYKARGNQRKVLEAFSWEVRKALFPQPSAVLGMRRRLCRPHACDTT